MWIDADGESGAIRRLFGSPGTVPVSHPEHQEIGHTTLVTTALEGDGDSSDLVLEALPKFSRSVTARKLSSDPVVA